MRKKGLSRKLAVFWTFALEFWLVHESIFLEYFRMKMKEKLKRDDCRAYYNGQSTMIDEE